MMENAVSMNDKTLEVIGNLLVSELRDRKGRMMDAINNGFPTVDARIEEYREIYNAERDFSEWKEDQ